MQSSTALARHKNGAPRPDTPWGELPEELTKADDGLKRWHQAFATTDIDLGAYLRLQAMLAAGGKPVKDDLAIAPRDGLEALLAVQMVGVHSLAMKFLAIAAVEGQTSAGIELSTNRADRLLRTFATQVETLKKYRSKGEQHCTVEHVHVHSGGQAVVGAVTARSRDRGQGIREMAINEPHAKRRGWLRNGNPTGDPSTASRCGARTRKGTPCKGPAMHNGRCRMHGGSSTGPRTSIGLARSRRADWKHGCYSARSKLQAKLLKQLLRECRAQCHDITAQQVN